MTQASDTKLGTPPWPYDAPPLHYSQLLSYGVYATTNAEVMVCNRAMGTQPATPIPAPQIPDPPVTPDTDRDQYLVMMAAVRYCEEKLEETAHLYDTLSQDHIRDMGYQLCRVHKIAFAGGLPFSYEVANVAGYISAHHDFVIDSTLARAELWSVNPEHPDALCPTDWENYTTYVLGITALYEYRVNALEEYYEHEITRHPLLFRTDMEYRRAKRRLAAQKLTIAHQALEFMKSMDRIRRNHALGSTTER